MKQTVPMGAVLALLTSTAAFAQTDAPVPNAAIAPPPELQSSPQGIEIPPPPPAEPGFDASDDDSAGDAMRRDRREWRRGGMGGDGWRGHGSRGMGYHGPQHHGWANFMEERSRGARFTFSQGDGSPSVVIKCADGDTTLECANAVMPMLDRFLPAQPAATTTP